ncbi:STM2901 family protein [Burkholderia cepacia]
MRTTTRAVCRTHRNSYNGHVDLKPGDLFFWIAVDEIQRRVGLDDLAAASAMLLGQADVPASGKFAAATKGTSVASIAAFKLLPIQMRMRLPMIMSVGAQGVRIASTRNLGVSVGRTTPVVGQMFLAADAAVIMFNTVRRYNAVVKLENRAF